MDVETLDLYECYFKNRQYKIFLSELYEHHCRFCRFCSPLNVEFKEEEYKTEVAKIILEYLNHCRLVSSLCWSKMKYFFKSIRLSGFLDSNIVGKWKIEKWEEKDVYILYQVSDNNCIYYS